ncbi:DUF4097 family beta strand repeat-containing protein [Streptomyces ziwulingensis]|uniref:DUF4097 family beta strand repeat-containing protein n=1 Tax=Streptomyces ziwulingensis TaxID=1045501 RepID=A0ABP9CVW7_9ACTN
MVIAAGDRADTTVRVGPADTSNSADTKAVERTEVDFTDGELLVRTPQLHGLKGLVGAVGSVAIRIELPAGSSLTATATHAALRAEGALGECRVETAGGRVELDRTGTLQAATSEGDLVVGHVAGGADIDGASGSIRIHRIDGGGAIQSASGALWIGHAAGELNLSTANGEILVDRADAGVSAVTADGSIRIGRLRQGKAELMTATGNVEVGIAEGSAAWIDAQSKTGSVRNSLAVHDGPGDFERTVEVRAHTHSGDVVVHRAGRPGTEQE